MLLSVLAGCGNGEDSASDGPSADGESETPSVSETPSATASASESEPTITVSTKTTCDQLFGGKGEGPLEAVVDWWSTDEGMTGDLSLDPPMGLGL